MYGFSWIKGGNFRALIKSAGISTIMLASLACGLMAAAAIFIDLIPG